MSTEGTPLVVSGIHVEVVRKKIKNLHLGVYPPAGRVRVAAPHRLSNDAVRLAVVSRLGWIRRQQAAFERQDRESPRDMVTGESHYFLGRRYRLRVTEGVGRGGVSLSGNKAIVLAVPVGTDWAARRNLLQRWYRDQLRELVPRLLTKWERKLGVRVAEVRIRRMKTRWGSCNAVARRVWLNLQLAKKAPLCVEYVLVHEMVHMLERRHTARFQGLMDELMPNWRLARRELNSAPLAHDDWEY